MLSIQNLTFGWSDQLLFHNTSCSLGRGQIVFLKGENGSGKTTLLQLIAGMIPHFRKGEVLQGNIFINNISVFENPPQFFFPYIAFIPSSHIDFFLLNESLNEDITLTKSISSLSKTDVENKMAVFEHYFHDISLLSQKPYKEMNLQQKAISLLFIYYLQDASLFLIDEMFDAFAPENQLTPFLQFLNYLSSLNKSIIIVSHQIGNANFSLWKIKNHTIIF